MLRKLLTLPILFFFFFESMLNPFQSFHSAELGLKYVSPPSFPSFQNPGAIADRLIFLLFCSLFTPLFDHFLITLLGKKKKQNKNKKNRGPWPKKKYAKLYRAQGQVLATLALLAAAYSRMSLLTCKRLATRSDLMHPAFVSPLPSPPNKFARLFGVLAFWLSFFCCHAPP